MSDCRVLTTFLHPGKGLLLERVDVSGSQNDIKEQPCGGASRQVAQETTTLSLKDEALTSDI